MTADLRSLSTTRLQEAQLLLLSGAYSGAYYLAGYAVECAFKACVTRRFKRYELPDKRIVADTHTHDLERLAELAGLHGALRQEAGTNPRFEVNWNIVRDWNEAARYALWSKSDAEDIIRAISVRGHGVLPWIKRHW